MSQACAEWRGDLGAYIVGALDSSASADVRRHLRGCANCRSEYEDLLPVRDWLTQARGANGSAVRRKAGDPVLRVVPPIRVKKGRRWVAAISVAAAAAAIGLLTSLESGPVAPILSAADHATGVHGQARLQETPAGTRIVLTVKGLRADERCRLVAVSRRGADVAASWSARYDGTARIIGTSSIPERQLIALRVETVSHKPLLTIRVASFRPG
jgi:hypothetical protein